MNDIEFTYNEKSIFRNLMIFIAFIFGLAFLKSMFFVVDVTEVAAVFQFGKPISGYNGENQAGLKIKKPWPFQTVEFETGRYFLYDSSPKDTLTADKKMLSIDEFMPARIVDPVKFLTTVKSISGAQSRIDDTAYSFLNNIFGEESYDRIVKTHRDKILEKATKITQKTIAEFGLFTPMVRVSRVDLPEQNTQAVFERMVSERKQEANKYRAQGLSEMKRIVSGANTKAVIIREGAREKAQSILGEADAKAIELFNSAATKDPEFFNFFFSLDTAKRSFDNENVKEKTIILRGNESFLGDILK